MADEMDLAHVAIIMDGNGRWARQRKLPRTAGHREGVKATRKIIEACAEAGVRYLTLFAFSQENWNRPEAEVSMLMDLFLQSLENEVGNLAENGIRLKFLGQSEALSEKLFQQMQRAEQRTLGNERMFLNIAVNYSGKWDMLSAAKKLMDQVRDGLLSVSEIDEKVLENELTTASMPAPDLFIRTGGEQRISNFLLWQLAYTELYFCDVLWPDFTLDELDKAFDAYRSRQRRFGRTQEQIAS